MNNYSIETLKSMSQAAWYNRWILNHFKKYLHGDILEVGSGTGNFTNLLKKSGKVWAIDINEEYIKEQNDPRIGFGDIELGKYFFKNHKFDCVVCLNVLEHIKGDMKALDSMYGLLNPSGVLILLVPAHQSLYGTIDRAIGHYKRYETGQLDLMLRNAGFNITSSKQLNWLGAMGWWLANKTRKTCLKNKDIWLFNLLAPTVLLLERFIELSFGISILVIAKKQP